MKNYKITVNGTCYDVTVEESTGAPAVSTPAPAAAPAPAPKAASTGATTGTAVKSPMPGNILDIKVAVGDSVSAGQSLLILEAMKMENDIPAPQAGVVESILVNKGDSVEVDAVLVTIK